MSEDKAPAKYSQDGVNVPVGDAFSALAGKLTSTTHQNCPYVEVLDLSQGNFRGPKPYVFTGFPLERLCLEPAPDGIGTKVVIHDALGSHYNADWDLMAMGTTDSTRYGGLPFMLTSVLDVRSLGDSVESEQFKCYVSMIEGLVAAANEIGLVLLKGETAEVGACVGSDNPNSVAPFNWSGFVQGIMFRDKMILGDRVRPGDSVVALRENGFRSNGISAVRKAFKKAFGDDFYSNPDAQTDLCAAGLPSKLYDRALNTAHGWYEPDFRPLIDMRLIAHISGGGIGKFVELLAPTGLSAELDELYELPEIMRKCASWRGLSDRELYTTFNGGQGALVVLPVEQVLDFVELAEAYGIEAKPCGHITKSTKTRVSLFSKYNGDKLVFKTS